VSADFESLLRSKLGTREATRLPEGGATSAIFLAVADASSRSAPPSPPPRVRSLRAYRESPRVAPRSDAPDVRFDATGADAATRAAFDLFRRHGELSDASFTLTELRTAWRRLAKRLHPDRAPTLGSAPFLELMSSFRVLRRRFG